MLFLTPNQQRQSTEGNSFALLYKQNCLQFLFVVNATVLKQQMSKKTYPYTLSTEAS